MLDGRPIIRAVDMLANIKMNQYLNFKTVRTEEDILQHLRLKCQYEILDALNEILQAHKEDDFMKLDNLIEQINKGEYKTGDKKIDEQVQRLGFE